MTSFPFFLQCRCAGKRLHSTLFSSSSSSITSQQNTTLRNMFLAECRRHADLHHPHIVQLLGLYTRPGKKEEEKEGGDSLPMLLMERMHCSLRSCLEQHPKIPAHLKRRILYDVTLGLRFLHERPEPIIHRDLTANNVLLTEGFRAKISDLGMAKILPLHVACKMTMIPGTIDYMPPEAMVADPSYDTKLDMFSFGILVLHVVTQEWPTPHLLTSSKDASGRQVPHSEVERRARFFRMMRGEDTLKHVAKRCIDNDPEGRPTAQQAAEDLEPIVMASSSSSPSSPSPSSSSSSPSFPLLRESIAREQAERRRDALVELTRKNESQLHKILQDLSNKFTLNEQERDMLNDELKVMARNNRSVLYSDQEGEQTFDPTLRRFIVAYNPPALAQDSPSSSPSSSLSSTSSSLSSSSSSVRSGQQQCMTLNITSAYATPHPLSVTLRAPANIAFSGTFIKTVVSGLTKSLGVAVSGDQLCVVDHEGWHGIHICSISGRGPPTRKIVESSSRVDLGGMPLEKCWYPSGVAFDADKNIILVDTESHRVLKFDPDGTFLASSGKLMEDGTALGEFNRPVGVALAPSSAGGGLYVCDRGNDRVQVLDGKLLSLRQFGERGKGPRQFHCPWDVAFDSSGNIYVVDCSNCCVKVFTRGFGEFVRQIGHQGNGEAEFLAPTSICIDRWDCVYVTDKKHCCVKVFNRAGEFVMRFGGALHERPEFCFVKPMGIAVDDLGRVFVSDSGKGRVLMFQ